MAFETLSPNMNLPEPGVGNTTGPQWATDINSCLTIIDSHDHSSGAGVRITPSGLNINSDLTIQNNNLTQIRTVRLASQAAVLSLPADLGCLYEVVNDLYYNDGLGNQVRITQSGAVAGTPGSIANLVPPASASYSTGTSTFIFQSNVNTPGNLDAGFIILRNNTASSKGLTLSPPAAMGSDIAITLPAIPISTFFLTMDSSGAISANGAGDNSTTELVGTTIGVKDQGITQAKKAIRAVSDSVGAGGLAVAASSTGTFSTASSSYVDISPNQAIAITTLGNPVRIEMIGDGTGNLSTWTCSGTVAIKIIRDGAGIYQTILGSGTTFGIDLPPSALSFIDTPAAGGHTYKVQVRVDSGTSITVSNMKLSVYEL